MFGRIGGFFGESREELAKVNWPTRHELIGSTVLVLVVTSILTAFVFVMDFILSFLMQILIR